MRLGRVRLAGAIVCLGGISSLCAQTPGFQASPASINFDSVAVGDSAHLIDLTITNNGTGTLHFASTPVIQGSQASDFEACTPATGHCGGPFPWPTTLAAGAALDVKMAFTPGGNGARSAQLVLMTDATGSPQMVQLQGSGASLGVTGNGGDTATVTAGQTAAYNLTVTTISSVSGNVTMTCTGLPAGASCSFSPGSFTITGPGLQDSGLTVTTSARTAGLLRAPPRVWAVFLGVFALVFALPGKDRRRALLCVTGLLTLTLLVSCGGGSGGGGGTGTPAGTYTLTVTATAPSASNSVPLTLTVQ